MSLWIGQKSEEKKKESSLTDGEEIVTEDSTEYIKPQTVSRNSSSDTGTLLFYMIMSSCRYCTK